VKERFKVPETTTTAVTGGVLYGFSAGFFGIGGAVRGAFLAAFDLRKAVYIATAGAIVDRIPQDRFRTVIAVFLGLVALKLLIFP
jgi:uncharacterized protein